MSQRRAVQVDTDTYDVIADYSDTHNMTMKEAAAALVAAREVSAHPSEPLTLAARPVPEAEIVSGPRAARPATKADVAELLEAVGAEGDYTRRHVTGEHGRTRFQGMVGRGQLAAALGGPEVQRAQYGAEIDALQGRLPPELADVADVMRDALERGYEDDEDEGGDWSSQFALEDGE